MSKLVSFSMLSLAALLMSPWPAAAQAAARPGTQEANLKAYVELLRSDLRTQKVALITEMMQFTDAEDAKFWPVYREYELEQSRLNDDRIALIDNYARNYDTLTAGSADDLMTKALALEARRATVKQKYYEKLKTAVSPITAAKALQIENQIQLLIDLQIAASLPVAQ